MKWSRELKIARRSIRTAVKAASAMAKAQAQVPATLRLAPWSTRDPLTTIAGSVEVPDFGSNPGKLAMFVHSPSGPPAPGAPLIVLLHGCGQSAVAFARESGWTALSERFGVPLVLPEQAGENNHGRCFNWFQPTHVQRESGEALSIRQMVATAVERFGSDPKRIYIAASPPVAPWLLQCWQPIRTCSPPGQWSQVFRLVRRTVFPRHCGEWPRPGPPDPPQAGRISFAAPHQRAFPGHGRDYPYGMEILIESLTPPMAGCWPSNGRRCMAWPTPESR